MACFAVVAFGDCSAVAARIAAALPLCPTKLREQGLTEQIRWWWTDVTWEKLQPDGSTKHHESSCFPLLTFTARRRKSCTSVSRRDLSCCDATRTLQLAQQLFPALCAANHRWFMPFMLSLIGPVCWHSWRGQASQGRALRTSPGSLRLVGHDVCSAW